jgi:general secretion pathway protein C
VEIAQKITDLRGRPAREWIAEANRVLPAVAAVIVVLLIAWHGAQLIWSLMPGKAEFDWSQRPANIARTANPGVAADANFRAIATAHLFGEADMTESTEVVKAPETRLNLALRGTFAADDDSIAHAIIASGSKEANVYFVDDSLPGGATLHEVHVDRVILERGGAFETLRLPKKSQKLGLTRSPSASSSLPNRPVPGSPSQSAGFNASAFTEIIRPQPFMPNGKLSGYRVYPGRDRRTFAALGLRPGDLVTEINGNKLDNLQNGMDAFRGLGDATQMTVTIERNGTSMQLTLDSSKLNNAPGARQ